MPNKNYIKGRNFEYRVKKYYEKLGWDVHRKYASKGVMDLICIRNAEEIDEGMGICEVHYVQCKTDKKYIHPAELKEFLDHCNKFWARAILAYKDKKRHIVIERLN